jgi:hypothetical protein
VKCILLLACSFQFLISPFPGPASVYHYSGSLIRYSSCSSFRLIAACLICFIFGISDSIHAALQMSKIKHEM